MFNSLADTASDVAFGARIDGIGKETQQDFQGGRRPSSGSPAPLAA